MIRKEYRMPLLMLTALVAGVLLGVLLGEWYSVWGTFVNGVGQVFLHAISMIVIPLVFLSTVLGISNIGDTKSMGRIAGWTFVYYVITAVAAAVIGVILTDLVRPGIGAHCGKSDEIPAVGDATGIDWINIVPSNIFAAFSRGEILPILLFSLLFGFFVTKSAESRRNTINNLFESLNDVIIRITNFIIKFAPLGVFAIVMNMVGKQAGDRATLMSNFVSFGFFLCVVLFALILMGLIVLPIMVAFMAKASPIKHLKQIGSALILAFSSCSSYAAMPQLMEDAKNKSGVSNGVANFTIPLGMTFNKVGTIIYECVAVMFVAQVMGVEMSAAQQISLIGISIVTVLGAPSVPMAGVVTLAILLKAMSLPNEMIGMFMAIDVFCDMPKTMLNAYSVSCSALVVAKQEGEVLTV